MLLEKFPDLVSLSGESEAEGKKCIRVYLKREAEEREKAEIVTALLEGGYAEQYPVVFDVSGEITIQIPDKDTSG